jgi:hypothetical protein
MDGVRDAVSPLGDEDGATARRCGRVINRSPDRWRIVGCAIGRSAVLRVSRYAAYGSAGPCVKTDRANTAGAVTKSRRVARKDRISSMVAASALVAVISSGSKMRTEVCWSE